MKAEAAREQLTSGSPAPGSGLHALPPHTLGTDLRAFVQLPFPKNPFPTGAFPTEPCPVGG